MVSQSKRRRQAKARAQAQPPKPQRSAPRRKRRNGSKRTSLTSVTTSGTDFVGNCVIRGTESVVGKIIAYRVLTPRMMSDTRLCVEGKLWTRWRPRKLQLTISANGPSTAGGCLAIGWTSDVAARLVSNLGAVSAVMAMEVSATVKLFERRTINIPTSSLTKWYSTEGPEVDKSHGMFVVVLVAPPTGLTDESRVRAHLDLNWTVEWSGREFTQDSAVDHHLIHPTADKALFTTSDSSFDATVLTFKEHSGGSMVPWDDALPGEVYCTTPDPKSPSKVYYLSGGKNVECHWFSVVIGYATRGLVLHVSQVEAEAYQKTGAKEHCIKYEGASDYTSWPLSLISVAPLRVKSSITESNSEVDDLREQVKLLTLQVGRLLKSPAPSEAGDFTLVDELPFQT